MTGIQVPEVGSGMPGTPAQFKNLIQNTKPRMYLKYIPYAPVQLERMMFENGRKGDLEPDP